LAHLFLTVIPSQATPGKKAAGATLDTLAKEYGIPRKHDCAQHQQMEGPPIGIW
jgi:hypothetical protein